MDFNKRNAATKVACTAPLEPVCGCDGVDYANPCQADREGVKTFTKGKCKNKGGGNGNPGKGSGNPGKGGKQAAVVPYINTFHRIHMTTERDLPVKLQLICFHVKMGHSRWPMLSTILAGYCWPMKRS
ncbi:MAG: hypothetical protein IPH94_09525 [Saprospiraceae bacterium]|nr:hypothetical protein [Saprospiraceae bacterium]